VEESFPRSVLASFAVQSEGAAGIVVDATDFFLSDVYDVVGRIRNARLGTVRIDADRSYIDACGDEVVRGQHRGPRGAELRDRRPERRAAPARAGRPLDHAASSSTASCGCRIRRCAMRAFDPRAGLFAMSFFDFAQGFDSDYRQRGVVRWRLEPRDTAAYLRGELVEPVKPIVYYMDPASRSRTAARSSRAAAGGTASSRRRAGATRSASSRCPTAWTHGHARYPMIYWVHRQQRGPSVGPSYRDPRTGEILGTVVRMDSYRSLVNHDIYMGLLPAARVAAGLQLSAEAFAMARRRQHTAHEIGHTLGIAHNFIAATQGRASVMDYPYPLIRLNAQGRIDIAEAYRPSGGAHDTLAIRYAYTWYPNAAGGGGGLRRIVRRRSPAGAALRRRRARRRGRLDPVASQWVEGRHAERARAHDGRAPRAAGALRRARRSPASRWPC
jgi:hypothetical protein